MSGERGQALSVDAQRVLVQWFVFRVGGTNAASAVSLLQNGDLTTLAEALFPLLRTLCSPHVECTDPHERTQGSVATHVP